MQHNYSAEIFTGWYQKYFFLWKSPKNYQKKCFKAKYIWPSKPKVKTRQIRQHLWAKNGKKGRYTIISNKATFFLNNFTSTVHTGWFLTIEAKKWDFPKLHFFGIFIAFCRTSKLKRSPIKFQMDFFCNSISSPDSQHIYIWFTLYRELFSTLKLFDSNR